jgi:DNA-binding response OmpR family regulator
MRDRGTQVLLIEDDPDVQEIFSEMLADLGFEVRRAGRIEEGLQQLRAEPPDLLILDAGAVDRSADGLRAAVFQARIPVVVTSGGPADDRRFAGIPHNFLAKPFRPHQLAAAIEAVTGLPCPGRS